MRTVGDPAVSVRQQLVAGSARRVNAGVNPCSSITIHETGNSRRGANAAAHASLQARAGMGDISWHYTADDREVVQSYRDTDRCRHGGTDAANNTSIGIEICVNSDGDYSQAVARAARLTAALMQRHSIPISRVVQHNSWWGKNCPERLRRGEAGGWTGFLAQVQAALNNDSPEDDMTPQQAKQLADIHARLAKIDTMAFSINGGSGAESMRDVLHKLRLSILGLVQRDPAQISAEDIAALIPEALAESVLDALVERVRS